MPTLPKKVYSKQTTCKSLYLCVCYIPSPLKAMTLKKKKKLWLWDKSWVVTKLPSDLAILLPRPPRVLGLWYVPPHLACLSVKCPPRAQVCYCGNVKAWVISGMLGCTLKGNCEITAISYSSCSFLPRHEISTFSLPRAVAKMAVITDRVSLSH